MALPLIDKLDSFEIVRDRIALILANESAAQQVLATAAAEDPLLWTLTVYTERHFPIETWLNAGPALTTATAPIVSVWMESSNTVPDASSVSGQREIFEVTYNLDVMARGVNANNVAGGYDPADRAARLNCHAAVRLVRNILTATENRYLGLRSTIVWGNPVFENMDMGPADLGDTEPSFAVWNCRCRFKVKMTETAPEFTDFDTLNLVRVDVSDDTGLVFATEIP